ncbi:TPA: hypothetical protein ACLX3S_001446 [Streptococcus pneumoniae]
MMSKQFLFYDIEIYFILYHAFFILSDDSLLPYLLAYLLPYLLAYLLPYLLPYIEKSHQMMTFQREQKTVPVIL